MSETSSDESLDFTYTPHAADAEPPAAKKPPSKRSKLREPLVSNTEHQNFGFESNWSEGLPYEILLKIFNLYMNTAGGDLRKLNILRNVCQYWSYVSKDKSLLRTYSIASGFSEVGETMESVKFAKLFRQSLKTSVVKYACTINLSGLIFLTSEHLESVLKHCDPDVLEELNVASCKRILTTTKASCAGFEKVIVRYCPKIRRINMSGLEVRYINIFI